ncbi:hypothetical protein SPHINGOT1_10158 [Sphingomonas sp. T1]|nr:hypothetical protein SPHINGOT1_10158 [Sphingomonas sp. T1]
MAGRDFRVRARSSGKHFHTARCLKTPRLSFWCHQTQLGKVLAVEGIPDVQRYLARSPSNSRLHVDGPVPDLSGPGQCRCADVARRRA